MESIFELPFWATVVMLTSLSANVLLLFLYLIKCREARRAWDLAKDFSKANKEMEKTMHELAEWAAQEQSRAIRVADEALNNQST